MASKINNTLPFLWHVTSETNNTFPLLPSVHMLTYQQYYIWQWMPVISYPQFYNYVYNQTVWQILHSILMKRSDEAFRSSFCLLCNSLGERIKKPIFRFKSLIWGTNHLCPCKRRKETSLQVEELSINDNRPAFLVEIIKRIKFYSHQLMHFFIQLCISLLSYINT